VAESYSIELSLLDGEWYATVTRSDGECRFFFNTSVEALLDAQIGGWVAGYDD
jgi:hypothetical protein